MVGFIALQAQNHSPYGIYIGTSARMSLIDSMDVVGNYVIIYSEGNSYMVSQDSLSITGTPVDNQLAIWGGSNTVEGNAELTYTGGFLTLSRSDSYEGITISRDGGTNNETVYATVNGLELVSPNLRVLISGERIGMGGFTPIGTSYAVRNYGSTVEDTSFTVYLPARQAPSFYVDKDGGVGMPQITGTGTGTSILQYDRNTGAITYGDDAGGTGSADSSWVSIRTDTIRRSVGSESGVDVEGVALEEGIITVDAGLSNGSINFGTGTPTRIYSGITNDSIIMAYDGTPFATLSTIGINLPTGAEYQINGVSIGSGSGDVTKVGTPVDNQLAIWTDENTVEGNSELQYDGTNHRLHITAASGFPGLYLSGDDSTNVSYIYALSDDMYITSRDNLLFSADQIGMGGFAPAGTFYAVRNYDNLPSKDTTFAVYLPQLTAPSFYVDSLGGVGMPQITGTGTGTSILQYNRTTGAITYGDDAGGSSDSSWVSIEVSESITTDSILFTNPNTGVILFDTNPSNSQTYITRDSIALMAEGGCYSKMRIYPTYGPGDGAMFEAHTVVGDGILFKGTTNGNDVSFTVDEDGDMVIAGDLTLDQGDSIVLASGYSTGIRASDNDAIELYTSGGTTVDVDGNGMNISGDLTLSTGATVDNIETTITDDDTHVPTSGAIVDYAIPLTDTLEVVYDVNTIDTTYNGAKTQITVGVDTSATGIATQHDLASLVPSTAVALADSGVYDGGYVTPTDLDAVTVAATAPVQLRTLAPMLTDTVPMFVFGIIGDSTYFDNGDGDFGVFYNPEDTLYSVNMQLLDISVGDSCKFNIYWGDKMAATKTDSLFDAPEPIGAGMIRANRTLAVDDPEIPGGQDVWMEISAGEIPNQMPNKVAVQLNTYKIRD